MTCFNPAKHEKKKKNISNNTTYKHIYYPFSVWIVRNLYQNVFKQTVPATVIILKGDKQETLKIFNMKQEHL